MTTEQRLNDYLEAGFDGMLQDIAGEDPTLIEAIKNAIIPIAEAEASIDSINDSIERFNNSTFGKSKFHINPARYFKEAAWGEHAALAPELEIKVASTMRLAEDLDFFASAPQDVRNGIVAVNALAGAMRAQSEVVKLLLQRLRDTKKELIRTQAAFDSMM